MPAAELSPDFLADLYEAALDPDGLARIPALVRAFYGADSAGLWIMEDGQITAIELSAHMYETQAPYLAHFGKLDPWNEGILRRPGEVVLGCESLPERDLVKTEFYNDFARPFGFLRPIGAMMQLSPNSLASLGVHELATKHLFEEKDKRPLQHMLPHVQRALQLHLRRRQEGQAAGLGLDAFEVLSLGIVVCDAASEVVYANAAAEALARGGLGLVLGRNRKASALVPAEAAKLGALIHAAGHGRDSGAIRLTDRDARTALLVLVAPLAGEVPPPRRARSCPAGHAAFLEPARSNDLDGAFRAQSGSGGIGRRALRGQKLRSNRH